MADRQSSQLLVVRLEVVLESRQPDGNYCSIHTRHRVPSCAHKPCNGDGPPVPGGLRMLSPRRRPRSSEIRRDTEALESGQSGRAYTKSGELNTADCRGHGHEHDERSDVLAVSVHKYIELRDGSST